MIYFEPFLTILCIISDVNGDFICCCVFMITFFVLLREDFKRKIKLRAFCALESFQIYVLPYYFEWPLLKIEKSPTRSQSIHSWDVCFFCFKQFDFVMHHCRTFGDFWKWLHKEWELEKKKKILPWTSRSLSVN